MKNLRVVICCMIFIITLLPAVSFSALTVTNNVVKDDRGTSDTSDDLVWVRSLSMMTGMTYEEQMQGISSLNISGFAGYNSWGLADLYAVNGSFASSTVAELRDLLIIESGHPDFWYGRVSGPSTDCLDELPVPGFEYLCDDYHDALGIHPFGGYGSLDDVVGVMAHVNGGVSDALISADIGVWIVSADNPVAVPEPVSSALFIMGSGILGLKWFRRA